MFLVYYGGKTNWLPYVLIASYLNKNDQGGVVLEQNLPEMWLEPYHLHYHRDETVSVKLLQGYGMKKSQGDNNNYSPSGTVIGPAGEMISCRFERENANMHYNLVFDSGAEGIYTVLVKSEHSCSAEEQNLLFQWARILVPVGHHVHGIGHMINKGMEINPAGEGHYKPGDEIDLTVLFNGVPLADIEVMATYHLYEGSGYPHNALTNARGEVRFTINSPGHWMFRAQAVSNGNVHVATLVVPGVR